MRAVRYRMRSSFHQQDWSLIATCCARADRVPSGARPQATRAIVAFLHTEAARHAAQPPARVGRVFGAADDSDLLRLEEAAVARDHPVLVDGELGAEGG